MLLSVAPDLWEGQPWEERDGCRWGRVSAPRPSPVISSKASTLSCQRQKLKSWL